MSRRRKGGRPPGPPKQPRQRKRRDNFTPRPFQGLADEPQWIALRELVPAATAPLRLAPALGAEYGERAVTLATLLPMAWPAMTRRDGQVLVGLQRNVESGDPSEDVATAIVAALQTEPGRPVQLPAEPAEDALRLTDVIVDGELDITLHDGFEFWTEDGDDDPAVAASLERANESVYPAVAMDAARAAYWCRVPERSHVRWVLPEPEDAALTALARLGAGGGLKLREDTKFAGMFRASGLLVPVWDLPREPAAGEWEEPLAAFAKRYADALTVTGELDAAARRARQGLVGRQLTLR